MAVPVKVKDNDSTNQRWRKLYQRSKRYGPSDCPTSKGSNSPTCLCRKSTLRYAATRL